MDSPCNKICVINPRTRLCDGCARSIDEIAAWTSYTDAERRRIMAELPLRPLRARKA